MKVYIVKDYDDIISVWANEDDAENEASKNVNWFFNEYEIRGTP